jgi:hypothetical protein
MFFVGADILTVTKEHQDRNEWFLYGALAVIDACAYCTLLYNAACTGKSTVIVHDMCLSAWLWEGRLARIGPCVQGYQSGGAGRGSI